MFISAAASGIGKILAAISEVPRDIFVDPGYEELAYGTARVHSFT